MARKAAVQSETHDLARAIMAVALEQAARTGWEGLRLFDVAAALDLSLADIYRHYRDSDAIA
jgi:AcrR family transcriptional regulator